MWVVFAPDGQVRGSSMAVATTDDIDRLVATLSEPGVSAAMIEHTGRTHVLFEGEELPDHDMTAGVHEGFGYLSYSDGDHDYAMPAGDAASPPYAAHYVDYNAGTGVAIETLTEALREFLATAQRPTCIQWQDAP